MISPLDYLAMYHENVITQDPDGSVTGVFVKLPKVSSKYLNASLPDHAHPAFVVDGVEKEYIYIGAYSCAKVGEKLESMPYVAPYIAQETESAEDLRSMVKDAGEGMNGCTASDYGLLRLLAIKRGWTPTGNTAHGQSHGAGNIWEAGISVSVGSVYCFGGRSYRCEEAHTTTAETRPDVDVVKWSKTGMVGGDATVDGFSARYGTGITTYSGTGPMSWCLGNDISCVCDLVGNVHETPLGIRIHQGEIQVLPNNDASEPDADLSEESTEWKAILPGASATDYTYVTPGTAGTIHYNKAGSLIEIDTRTDSSSVVECDFLSITANARVQNVPCILYELGLLPVSGDTCDGKVTVDLGAQHAPVRLYGDGASGTDAGLGRIYAGSGSGIYAGMRARLKG